LAQKLKKGFNMSIGTVLSYSIRAGYGFVKLDNGESCFFNNTDIKKDKELKLLRVGQEVKILQMVDEKGVKVFVVFPM
jgi:cold shock CspA family protein